MTTIPITILEDFLDNPIEIRNWALTLEYFSSPDGNYPGKRTLSLDELHPLFHKMISQKILNLFFPDTPLNWECTMHFHLTKNLEKTGWLHQDTGQITSIIYLSPEDSEINRGTSFYNLKPHKPHPFNNQNELQLLQHMPHHHLTGKISDENFKAKDSWEKDTFDKILDIPDKFNRLVCFDPSTFHASNSIISDNSPDRLTLIAFLGQIAHPVNFPIPRSKHVVVI